MMKMINKNTTDVYLTYDKLFWLHLTGCVAGVIIEGVFVWSQKDIGKVMLFLYLEHLMYYMDLVQCSYTPVQ